MNAAALTRRLRRPETRRFIAYLLTGGLAAAVNILSRILFETVVRYEIAVALAFPVAMTTAFLLAKVFVFPGSGRSLHVEYGRFALVNIAALLQVLAVSVILAKVVFPAIGMTWNAETIAHIIGVLSPVVVSYHGHKRFSFA